MIAQPTGGQVVAGTATFSATAGALTVTQTSGRAIINWQDFSIAAGELTKFVQPDATSATLNRVVSGLPSTLAGTLQANGRIFLINPNGILVGAGARIDTGGFLASTLDVANNDFLAGGDLHFTGGSTTAIKNLGAINALGGDVFLIARQVENSGAIAAANGSTGLTTGGTVGLAAGSEVLLTTGGNERLFVQAASLPGTIINAGTITAATAELKAAGGNAYALAINNSGVVRATGSAVRNGQIWLVASGNSEVDSSGTLDASSATASGGRVVVTGGHVLLDDGARIDASGATGGGEIYVGGGWQGKDATMANASAVVMQPGAMIDVSATGFGNGGTAVLWSQDYTAFQGNITATGGRNGGNGGAVETSSHNVLQAFGQVDASAASGLAGSWLLDPFNVVIAGASPSGTAYATTFTPAANSVILASSISNSLMAGTDVTITTGASGASAGDITVNAAITQTNFDVAPSLTLKAANNINITSTISGLLNVVLTADADESGTGSIDLGGVSQIVTNGGSFYAGLMDGGFSKKGQNLTLESGSFIDVGTGQVVINVNGTVTLAGSSLRTLDNGYGSNTLTITSAGIATSNAVATTPDIVTTTSVALNADTIGSAGTPIKISAGASPSGNGLVIVNQSGNSYVNEIQMQAFSSLNLTVGNQINSTQNVQIMGDAGGNGTTGTGHVILQTDGAGLLNIATNNIKTGGGGGGATATHVTVNAPNMTFADGSVNTGTANFTAQATAEGGTLSSIQVNGTGDISAPTVTFIAPNIGTLANPLELGLGTTLNVDNTGGSTFIKSVSNDYTQIFLSHVQTPGTHSILFSGGDHLDYTTDGSAVFLPTIGGGASDGHTFGSTTGIDVTRRNRNVTLIANSADVIFDNNSVNTGSGKFTVQLDEQAANGVIAALNAYNSLAPVAQITAGDVEFDIPDWFGTLLGSTIGSGGKDIQIAQGTGAANSTLTVNTQQGNVTIHELSPNHFKTLNITLNSASVAQHVAIDLNGPDDVNFSDNGSLVLIDATKVNLSANNRNWNLQLPSRSAQIDGTSLGSGYYFINAGNGLNLNGDVLTNGGEISLTSDDYWGSSTGIHLLKSVRIDSNADDTGNTTSTGVAGAITLNGTLMSSTIGSSRTLTVDASSSTTGGGQILMISGASDRSLQNNYTGEFLTGLTLTAKGSTNTNDGIVYINWDGTNYYLNGNFSSTGFSYLGSVTIIDTEQGNHADGGSISFGGQDLSGYYSNSLTFNTATTAAGRNGGNVDLFGTFSHSTLSTAEITVNTVGGAGGTSGSISLPAVATSYPGYTGFSGLQSYTGGVITLNGNLTTDEGAVILTGDTRLAANVIIDTWQHSPYIQTGTAGAVTISGTGISALAAGRTLTIDTSTNTVGDYFNDQADPPTPLLNFTHNGGNVAIVAGNAGGAYIGTLVVNTTNGGTHNTSVGAANGTIALNTVGTEGAQTYTGGATTVSGSLTSNGGNIDLSGVASLALSGAAVTFDTDRAGGTSDAGSLLLGARTLNGAVAVTIDTTADGGGAGAGLALNSVGAVTPLSSLNAAAATLTVGGTGVTASGGITLEARGAASDLTLNAAVTSTGGNIALVAGRNFINGVGSTVLTASAGRWLVYSTSPAGSTENGLTAAAGSTLPRLYYKTFAGNAPASIAAGNHLIYSTQPTLTVTAGDQTRAYGNANASFSSVISGFVSDDGVTDTATTAGLTGAASLTSLATATSPVSGSPFTITAAAGNLASGAGYGFSLANGTLVITARPVTVTASTGQTKVYGAADPGTFTFTSTSLGSGIALSGSLTRVGGETVSGGPYAITQGTVTNANNPNYSLTYAGANFAITPATLTYTATAATRLFGASDPAFSGTITGFITGESQANATTGTMSFATTATVASVAGSYPLNGAGLTANNGNYLFTQAAGNATAFTIGTQAPLTITADAKSKTYGAPLPTFTASFAGFVNGDTASSVTGLQFSTTATIGSNVGTFTITPFGATAPASYLVGYVPGTLTINPATLTYTATAATRFFGASNPAFSGTVTGFVNGDAQGTATTGTLSFATTATVSSVAGRYPLNGAGLTANNGNYLFTQAAGNATAFTIGTQAPLTITADAKSKTYGAALPAFTASFAGFINGDTASSVTGLQFSTTATIGSNVGTFAITPFGATAPASYLIGYVPGTLTINPAALTLTANSASRTYGAANPAFSDTVVGFVNGDTSSVISGLSFTTPATAASGVGAYTIVPTGAVAANYTLTFVAGTLTINRASLTITAGDASRDFGAVNPSFSATFGGFVNGDNAAVVSGLIFTTPATTTSVAGDYAITPLGATAANYTFAFVNGTLQVLPPTVIVDTTPTPVATINQQPVLSPDLAVILQGGRLVLIPVDPQGSVINGTGSASASLDGQLTVELSEVTSLPRTASTTNSPDAASGGGATMSGQPNPGGFELVASLGGAGGGTSPGSVGGLTSAQMTDPGLFRESTVSLGKYNVIYHEALADARQQAGNNTAQGSSYREFLDTENPRVDLVRATPGPHPGDEPANPAANRNSGGAL